MALKSKGKRAIQKGVDENAEFEIGNVSGTRYGNGPGQLPNPFRELYLIQRFLGQIEYVLYSYETPMAWRAIGFSNWIFPGVKYSVTTSNHQNVMRVAIANPGFYKDAKW